MITSMPMVWSVVFCVEVGFLAGGMRAEAVRFARRAVHTLFARTAGVNRRYFLLNNKAVNVSRVPQVPVWTCGGYKISEFFRALGELASRRARSHIAMSSRSHIHYGSLAEVERDRLAKLEAETKQKLESLRAATKGGAPAASAPAAPEPELINK